MTSHATAHLRPPQANARPTRFRPVLSLLLVVAIMPAGCTWIDSSPVSAEPDRRPAGGVRPPPPIAYRYPDHPPVLDAQGLQTFVRGFKYQVVLLDVWASWSHRARAEMPELARLNARLGRDGLQIISCSLDAPEHWNTQVVPALLEAGANFPCVLVRQDAKAALRAWLAPDWSYDLPARFIIDRMGRVALRATGSTPFAGARDRVEQMVMQRSAADRPGRFETGAAALRLRLVDVGTGAARSLPESTSNPPDPRKLAQQAADFIAGGITHLKNPRVAVLPFRDMRSGGRVGALGRLTTRHLVDDLRRRGFETLIEPNDVQRMIDKMGQTALSVDFEPSVVVGRLPCDFLVIGWLQGAVEAFEAPQAMAADGSAADSGADDAMAPPRHSKASAEAPAGAGSR